MRFATVALCCFFAAVGLFNAFEGRSRADEQPANAEDAKLEAFFKDYLERVFATEPLTATRLGDHRFDDKLDDLSPEARAFNLKRDRDTLADLPRKIDKSKLSRDGKIDFEIVEQSLTRSIWLAETFHPFENDPRIYGDYVGDGVYLLLTQSTLLKQKNVSNALRRIEQIPKLLETARKTLGKSPRVKVETAIRQTKGAISFFETEFFELAGLAKDDADALSKTKPTVESLKRHLAFLEKDILPKADDDWRIGKERFARKLELELDANISADEVLAEAEAEAVRVESEMYDVACKLWKTRLPNEPLPPGHRETVRKVLDAVAKDHGAPDKLVADARATVKDIKEFIRTRDLLRLPEPDRCRIVEMPEFKRGNAVAYLEPAPPLDPTGSSEFAISPPPSDWSPTRVESFLREYNQSMLKILTIHEAYPGHYVQLEYSNRCPSLIRKVLSSGTFAEGWAVYTERMMLDNGFGGDDLGLKLNQLKFYLRAVANAILDRRMHVEGMTDEEAKDLLMNRCFQTEGEAVGKIIRSKQSSCQLSTYFVGRLAFVRLRKSIEKEMGASFDLGRYHEATLSHGTLPVKYLPDLVRDRLKRPR